MGRRTPVSWESVVGAHLREVDVKRPMRLTGSRAFKAVLTLLLTVSMTSCTAHVSSTQRSSGWTISDAKHFALYQVYYAGSRASGFPLTGIDRFHLPPHRFTATY